jgi:hypothetical protein
MSELINNQANAVETTPAINQEFDFSSLVEKSANLNELKPVITLTADYIELEKPSEYFDGIFIGYQDMELADNNTGEMKTLKAGRFLINKQVFINAGAVLVRELERSKINLGTPVRVTYLRKDGNTKIYTLTLLG